MDGRANGRTDRKTSYPEEEPKNQTTKCASGFFIWKVWDGLNASKLYERYEYEFVNIVTWLLIELLVFKDIFLCKIIYILNAKQSGC